MHDSESCIEELKQKLQQYKVFLGHAVPDNALFHLAVDVVEQAAAASIVAATEQPRAAMANARAAFEAAIDMLLLVAEPSMYDEWGAAVRSCELLAWEELRKRRAEADRKLQQQEVAARQTAESIMQAEAGAWAHESPGAERMYRRVFAQARAQQRWKRHWSGLGTFAERVEYIERKLSAYAGFSEIAKFFWSLQSYHAHPASRNGIRPLELDAGVYISSSRHEEGALAVQLADAACKQPWTR